MSKLHEQHIDIIKEAFAYDDIAVLELVESLCHAEYKRIQAISESHGPDAFSPARYDLLAKSIRAGLRKCWPKAGF